MVVDVPLVGRVRELERIVSRLTEGDKAAFVVAGPAGVGKSRLAAEGMKAAVSMGFGVAHVVATKAAASIPFGPFAPLMPEAGLPSGDLLDLLRSVGDAIVKRTDPGQPLLLVVDDAHLLDDGSAALIHQLAHGTSCGLLATVRTPGPAPDPVTALWKDGLADRVDLGPLSEAEIAEFAAAVLGGAVAGASVRRLRELSAGNALFLRELLLGSVASGALAEHDGFWILRHPLTAPDRLVELVSTRLADLAPATVDVIDLLAVAGSLGFELVESLSSPAATEEAERLGLITVSEDGRRSEVRLTHPLYGEVRRQRLPRARLRHLWSQLAQALEATGARRREDLLRLATWQLEAGLGGDPATFGRAARRARQMFDLELAKRLARAAVDAGGGVEASLALAEAQFASGDHGDADRMLAALVPRCTTDAELVAVANAQAYNRSVLMGDPAGALALLDQALARVTAPAARLGLLGRTATISLFAAELETARATSEALLDSDDDVVVSRGLYVSSCALALLGRTAEAITAAGRGLAVHRRCVEPTQIAESQLIGATLAHAAAGALAEAEASAQTGYRACLEAGDQEGMATFSLLGGWVGIEQGRLSAASRSLREGAAINRELRDTGALRWCLGGVALAEGMARNSAAANAAIAELDGLRADWMEIFEADLVDRGRAWARVAAGEVSSARDALLRAADRAATHGQRVAEARLLHDLVRLGAPEPSTGRLQELVPMVDGALVSAFAAHATAVRQRSAPELDAASRRFAALGASLLAAESAVAAATLYRGEGRARQASACARRAEEYAIACGGLDIPGLGGAPDADRLTAREREVAGLAASGASSKEIAGRLYISLRTVENHLQSVYSKLGVGSREELAGIL